MRITTTDGREINDAGQEMDYIPDAHWSVILNDETGRPYWSGGCEGDKDNTSLDDGEPLILDPRYFPVGYRVTGESPLKARTRHGSNRERVSHQCPPCG